MDHHCPFTDSCVGWGNYKYYINLLLWGNVTMLSFIYVTSPSFWHMCVGSQPGEPEFAWSWYFLVEYLLIWVAEFLLVFLLLGHAVFIATDRTTIEWKETQHLGYFFSYWGKLDMWYTCAKRGLGTNPLLWFFPTRRSIEGDGVNFHKPFFRQIVRGSKEDPDAKKQVPEQVHSEP